MQLEPVVWQTVEWQQGDGRYRFELQQGGLHATLTAPQGRSFTIPTVAWYALFDALAAARKTKQRSVRWSRSFGQKFRFAKWIVCRG